MKNSVVLNVTQTKVRVDNDQNIQVVSVAAQGPTGPKGPEGPEGPTGPPGPSGSGNSPIRQVSVDTVMTSADGTIIANTASGDLTITLPVASTAYNSEDSTGQIFNVANAGQNIVTVECQDSDTINGQTSFSFGGVGNLEVQAGPPSNPYTIL